MRVLPLFAALAAILAPAASAKSFDPQIKRIPADQVAAQSALLKPSELGKAWKASTVTPSPSAITCNGTNMKPNQSDLTITGLTGTSLAEANTQVVQAVRVFRSKAQADASWTRTVTIALVDCAGQKLRQSSDDLKLAQEARLALPNVAPHTAGFRIVARAADNKTMTNVYLDLLLVGRDKTLTSVVLSTLQKPPDRAFEERIVRTVAQKLGIKPTA